MFKKLFKVYFLIIALLASGCVRIPVSNNMTLTSLVSNNNISLETVTGTINRLGGVVYDELETTLIHVPKSAVETDTQFSLNRKLNRTGKIITTIKTNSDSGPFQVILPPSNLLSQISPTKAQFDQIQGQKQTASKSQNTYPLPYSWDRQWSYFWKTHNGFGVGNRIGNQVDLTSKEKLFFSTTIHQSVELLSNCEKNGEVTCYQGKKPVLFVHGYVPSLNGLGGGQRTWKNFPALILKLEPKYAVFEFRWITAARFEDVAADLGRAIEQIAQATGQKVHIVAHSFAGILIRTYLQGFASHFPYRDNVASVTTVGSPHSGISQVDKLIHHVPFKRGQDTQGLLSGRVQINFCQQISCYQMGHSVNFTEEDLNIYQLNYPDSFFLKTASKPYHPIFDVPDDLDLKGKPGKLINVLSDMINYPLPKGLPIQVLIGLTVKHTGEVQEGDALISFEGQRLSPALTAGATLPLLNADTRYGGQVTERILGFHSEVKPGHNSPLQREHPDYWGYRHSSTPVGTLLNAKPMVQINCENVENCEHATFQMVKNWLQQQPSKKALPKKPSLTVNLRVIDAETQKPIPSAYVHIYRKNTLRERQLWGNAEPLIQLVQTNKDGLATTALEFESKATYYLDVKAWGYHGYRDVNPIRMGKTKAVSPSDWGTVRLTPKSNRKLLVGVITDVESPIANVDYVVKSGDIWWAAQTDTKGHFAMTGLIRNNSEVYFLKKGYRFEKRFFSSRWGTESVSKVMLRRDGMDG